MNNVNLERRLKVIEEHMVEIKKMLYQLCTNESFSNSTGIEEEVLTVKQVAKYSGMDVNTIYTRCTKGEIPFYKIGKGYRFKKKEIDNWLNCYKKGLKISVDDFVSNYLQNNRIKI